MWGESLEEVRETIARVRAAAAKWNRADRIRFSLSLRPVIGRTEAEAWSRAEYIYETAKSLSAPAPAIVHPAQSVGMQRLRAAAGRGAVLDKRLWTKLASLPNARGSTTGLVGTGEQIAEALLEYHKLGITAFLIRGFDPIQDALAYGREILPRVREAVAQRDEAFGVVTAEVA